MERDSKRRSVKKAVSEPVREFTGRVAAQFSDDWSRFRQGPTRRLAAALDAEALRRRVHRTAREVLFLTTLTRGGGEDTLTHIEQMARLVRAVPDDSFHAVFDRTTDWPDYVWPWVAGRDTLIELLAAPDGERSALLRTLQQHTEKVVDHSWRRPLYAAPIYVVEALAKFARAGLGVAGMILILVYVSPIREILRGRPWQTLGVVSLLGLLPLLVWFAVRRWRSKLGGEAVKRWASTGVFTNRRLRRPVGFVLDPRNASRIFAILRAMAIRCLALGLGAVAIAMLWLASGASITVPWLVCIAFAFLVFLHSADFFAWVAPDPVREVAFLIVALSGIAILLEPGRTGTVLAVLGIGLALTFVYAARGMSLLRKDRVDGTDRRGWLMWKYLPPLAIFGLSFAVTAWSFATRYSERWRDDDAATIEQVDPMSWPRVKIGADGKPRPVIVVAASGGGSRAAYYAARTFEMLSTHGWDDDVQMISSVSGGSLASAAYLAWRYNDRPDDPARTVEFVQRDFVEPVLRGMFRPKQSRGAAIEEAWATKLGTSITMSEIAARWNGGGDVPLPLFNTASLDGHGLVISPLPTEAYNSSRDRNADSAEHNHYAQLMARQDGRGLDERDSATWVYHRNGVYGLEDFVRFDPHLAQAVRASANFPFGFPVVEVETCERRFFSPADFPYPDREPKECPDVVRLTDGGARSNSGVWTLYSVLLGHLQSADTLRETGVLLVVVDASRMPTHGALLTDHIGNQDFIARNVHRRMIEVLERELDGRFGVVQIDIPALDAHNAYTSWALDNEANSLLRKDFDAGEPGWAAQIEEVMTNGFGALRPPSQLPRVPLD